MSPALLLPYGLADDGRLVSVASVESGKACNLLCPACFAPLIARKGDETRHHFAHAPDAECFGGLETMLHKLAKQIICDDPNVWLPPAHVSIGREVRLAEEASLFAAYEAQAEVLIGDVRPDVILTDAGRSVAVEVLVTHRSTPEKIAAYREMGIEAVEIDLSHLMTAALGADIGREVLELAPRTWLFNAKAEAEKEALRAELEARREAERNAWLEAAEVRRQRDADHQRALAADWAAIDPIALRRAADRIFVRLIAKHKEGLARRANGAEYESEKNATERENGQWKQDIMGVAVRYMGSATAEAWANAGPRDLKCSLADAGVPTLDEMDRHWNCLRVRLIEMAEAIEKRPLEVAA